MSGTLASRRRSRWAISFADLLLLLLGFFVMLHASGQRRDALLAGVSRQFGGRPMARAVEVRAAELFAPGEAMLTPAGRARIARIAAMVGRDGAEVQSHGSDAARERFDDWDLAAARLGSVARALRAAGVPGDRLVIRGLDQADGQGDKGQVIRIAPASTAQ